jgi:hypothetical protein
MFTFSRFVRSIVGSFVVATIAFGCGGDDEGPPPAKDACGRVAVTSCDKIFECTSEAERTLILGLPGVTKVDCKAYFAQNAQCEMATPEKVCAGANPYPISQAETCLQQINAATCATVKTNTTNFAAYAPACVQCLPKL